jgi:hypothetical protein
MAQERPRATHDSWHTLGMPAARIRLPVERAFSAEAYHRISDRLIPRQMEDQWCIYLDSDWLAFHPSWTGFCSYRVRLEPQGARVHIAEAWANCEASQRFGRRIVTDAAARLVPACPAGLPAQRDEATQISLGRVPIDVLDRGKDDLGVRQADAGERGAHPRADRR